MPKYKENRIITVSARYTLEEYEQLKLLMKKTNIKTLSEYVRVCSLRDGEKKEDPYIVPCFDED